MASASHPSSNLASFLPVISIRLDRGNYTHWRYQVVATIRAHGYDDLISQYVEPPPQFISSPTHERSLNPDFLVWSRRDQFLVSWLVGSVTESMIGHITRCQSARDLWFTLENLFQSQSKARVMQLKLQLQTQKKGDMSIDEFFLKMRSFADSLAAVGKPVGDDDLILHILAGFGSEFDAVVVNLTNRSDTLSLQEVQYALQAHEIRLQSNNSPLSHSANYVGRGSGGSFGGRGYTPQQSFGGRGYSPRGRGGGGRGPVKDSKIVCQLCGKPNHVAIKCYKRFDVHFTGVSSPQAQYAEVPQVYCTDAASEAAQEEAYYASLDHEAQWYADSGATAHVTNDLSNIQLGSSYSGTEQLAVGNGHSDSNSTDEGGAAKRTVSP